MYSFQWREVFHLSNIYGHEEKIYEVNSEFSLQLLQICIKFPKILFTHFSKLLSSWFFKILY